MKKIIGILLCLTLVFSMTSVVFAGEEATDGNLDLEQYVADILNGKIQPRNENPEFTVSTTYDKASNRNLIPVEENEFELTDQNITKDVRKIGEDSGTETYRAVIIIENEYTLNPRDGITPYLSNTNEDVLSDVTMYGEITYEKILLTNGNYGYKISKVKGGYMSTADPQMTCSELLLRNKYFGRLYSSNGVYSKTGGDSSSSTFTSPSKGSIKSLSTNQTNYVQTDDGGYNAAQIHYTVRRLVSSFTASDYISLGFGEIINPWG